MKHPYYERVARRCLCVRGYLMGLFIAVALTQLACRGASVADAPRLAGATLTPTALPTAPSTATEPSTPHPAFPRQRLRDPGEANMQALIEGRLSEEDGCLLIGDKVAVWPHEYSLDASDRTIRVLDGSGREVARVGDWITTGGGVVEAPVASLLRDGERLPEHCQRPYALVQGPVRSRR